MKKIFRIVVFLYLLIGAVNSYGQDFRTVECDASTGFVTGDLCYWNGAKFFRSTMQSMQNSYGSIYYFPDTANDQAPTLGTAAQGTTWAPTISDQRAGNFGGWCTVFASVNTAAAPGASTAYLIFNSLPWDVANLASTTNQMCGAVYLRNSNTGVEENGYTFAIDNTDTLHVFRPDLSNFTTDPWQVFFQCTYRCDSP